MTASPTVVILGAGVSGLCMGIQLLRAGISSFTILEKSDRVGGTCQSAEQFLVGEAPKLHPITLHQPSKLRDLPAMSDRILQPGVKPQVQQSR